MVKVEVGEDHLQAFVWVLAQPAGGQVGRQGEQPNACVHQEVAAGAPMGTGAPGIEPYPRVAKNCALYCLFYGKYIDGIDDHSDLKEQPSKN